MPPMTPSVICTRQHRDRLPDWSAEGVALALDLTRRGWIGELGDRVRIRRQGGYAGIDALAFLLFFFSARVHKGVRTFWEEDARPFAKVLGAVLGRKRLPSSASMSRALDGVEFEETREFGPWLLREVAGIEALLRHPATRTTDALGRPWQVFDFDPTVHTLRHRALPEGEDLPEARRRSEDTAAPGYSGRKRGDVQLRRATLQHAGSGAWLDVWLGPGNGEGRKELGHALDVAAETCDRLAHPREQSLFRADGEFGNVPSLTAARQRGLRLVSRLTRPGLLDQPEVRERLAHAIWYFVPDSGCAPRRSATELGTVRLTASQDTRHEDGSPYEPLDVRVVVSRYPREGEPNRGRIIDGWQYELFIADADAEAWPAPEAVSSFFARTGEENRFAQEDRELVLDRIFSYHLPGQEFAVLVGLLVWNLQIARGLDLEPVPDVPLARAPRVAEVDARLVPVETSTLAPQQGSADVSDAADVPDKSLERSRRVEPPTGAEQDLCVALGSLDWVGMLSRRTDWSFAPEAGHLLCPQQHPLELTCVSSTNRARGFARLLFRSALGVCCSCPSVADCFPTARPQVAKLVDFHVPIETAESLRVLLAPVHTIRRHRLNERGQQRSMASDIRAAPPEPQRRRRGLAIVPPSLELTAGPYAIEEPLFLPAGARHRFSRAARHIDVVIQVELPPEPLPHPALLARSRADRQHRRCTWEQNLNRYALPAGTQVRVFLHGGEQLGPIVGAAEAPGVPATG